VKEGKTIRELSQIFKVSKRTVQRALKVSFGENGVYRRNPGVKSEDEFKPVDLNRRDNDE